MSRNFAFAVVVYSMVAANHSYAQVTPVTLEVEIHNLTIYTADTLDVSKFATEPGRTTPVAPRNFGFNLVVGDIVMVNSKPARGSFIVAQRLISLSPTPGPGQGIADGVRTAVTENMLDIQQADGTPVGGIYCLGLAGGSAPVGAPTDTANNLTIAGGTGAFLGARGQMSSRVFAGVAAVRTASVTEDPQKRRDNAGGERVQFIAQVIPMTRPEIAMLASGPAVFHSDFSPVTAARPARAGEVLIGRATGLGATRPGVLPGQPFPSDVLQEVSAPVEVLVSGREAEVVNKVGWPGTIDTYRIDFQVPDGTESGLAKLRLSAAWIPGAEVQVPIQ